MSITSSSNFPTKYSSQTVLRFCKEEADRGVWPVTNRRSRYIFWEAAGFRLRLAECRPSDFAIMLPPSELANRAGPVQLRRVRYRRGHRLFFVLVRGGSEPRWGWPVSDPLVLTGDSWLSQSPLCDSVRQGAWRKCASGWKEQPAIWVFGRPRTAEVGSDCPRRRRVLLSFSSSRPSGRPDFRGTPASNTFRPDLFGHRS